MNSKFFLLLGLALGSPMLSERRATVSIRASGNTPVIPVAELRRTVRALYPNVDVDHERRDGPAALLVVLRFDAMGNVTGHKIRERTTDRMRPMDVLQAEFGAIEWRDVDHCGVVPLTGDNEGVRRGTVWVVWAQLRR